MRLFVAFALLACAAVSAHDFPEDDNVIVLTDETFDDAMKEFGTILVEFYAPWCGHCKRLAPEYAKAAKALKEEDPPLYIAKVDATEEQELGDRFGIRGFPTLKLFRNGKESEYEGGRSAEDIVRFMKRKSGPPTKEVSDADALEAFKGSAEVAVVGVFESTDSDEFKTFVAAALGNDDVPFAHTTSADVAAALEVTAPAVVLFKQFDEGRVNYEGELEEGALSKFVASNELPVVVKFSPDTARKLFAPEQPIKTHMLVFADEEAEGHEALMDQFRTVATEFRGEALFVFVSSEEDRVMSYFGFEDKDLPASVIVRMADNGMKKFRFTADQVSEETMRAFVTAYKAGELKPFLKSEEAPAENDEPVTVVVGNTFDSIVLDDEKDVMLEFYAPWCGHCKSLAPKYEELGEMFEDIKSVVIAKMDATANEVDHPGVNVQGFPTIIFFPAGKKDSPIEYSGARTAEALAEFIQKNAGTTFSLDDAAAEEEEEEESEEGKDEL